MVNGQLSINLFVVGEPIHYSPLTNHYSVLKLFTGFAIAAFIAWKLTVSNATSNAAAPAIANSHQLMLILYEKSCSHLCITYHAIGNAMTLAMITSFTKSFDNSRSIFDTEAPNT